VLKTRGAAISILGAVVHAEGGLQLADEWLVHTGRIMHLGRAEYFIRNLCHTREWARRVARAGLPQHKSAKKSIKC
jgi:hypothetical protein